MKKNLSHGWHLILIIIIAGGLAFMFSYIADLNTLRILRQAARSRSMTGEIEISKEDMQIDGWEVERNQWTATKDVQEMALNEMNMQVDYVTVIFQKGLNKRNETHILWTNAENPNFSDERLTGIITNEGMPYILLPVGRYVKDLKIETWQREGEILPVEKILINSELNKCTWENVKKNINYNLGSIRHMEKAKILFVAFLLFLLPLVFGWERFFDKRWLIGGLLLLFLVANKYNGDSLGIYDSYVQRGEGSEFVNPVIGEARHIRSDEWGYMSPKYISTRYLNGIFEKNNYIIRGNNSINEYAMTWYAVYNPFIFMASILRLFIGFEYAYSFKWYAVLIFTFIINIDFFMMVTKNRKLLSFCAASMIALSSFYQWWIFPEFVTALPAIFVYIYYFIHAETLLGKVASAAGTGIFTTYYMLNFYPPWQVPIGYLMLALLAWMVYDEFERIKNFDKRDWLMVCITGIFCLAVVAGYLWDCSEYTQAMMETIYPGRRFSTGGFSLFNNIWNFFSAGLYPYKFHENPSGGGTFVSLFPLPICLGIYYQIKNRWKNCLVNVLLLMDMLMLIYTTVGIPAWLAKISLISYSPPNRMAEILGYSQVLLFAAVVACWNEKDKFDAAVSGTIAVLYTIMGLYISNKRYPGYMPKTYMIFVGLLFAGIVFAFLWKHLPEKLIRLPFVGLIIFCMITGLYVRPIEKGLDAIDSKPLASAIRKVVEDNPYAKWLGQGTAAGEFAVACGAPTINFANYYPNRELWGKLDSTGIYEAYYNRFSYVSVEFSDDETSFSNPQVDVLAVQLSYKDMGKTDLKYIVSTKPLDVDNNYVFFDCIYDESDAYIYEVHYKNG